MRPVGGDVAIFRFGSPKTTLRAIVEDILVIVELGRIRVRR